MRTNSPLCRNRGEMFGSCYILHHIDCSAKVGHDVGSTHLLFLFSLSAPCLSLFSFFSYFSPLNALYFSVLSLFSLLSILFLSSALSPSPSLVPFSSLLSLFLCSSPSSRLLLFLSPLSFPQKLDWCAG